ncbi:MAG TPA: hypothetical protein VN917_11575 [Xanthobacteraceae bacterium]|nr:hypothetical protein [Xanthobacteraceae bacterium]
MIPAHWGLITFKLGFFQKVLVAGIAAAAFYGAPALSADLSTREPVYKVAPAPLFKPLFNWTGFYAGGNVGAHGRSDPDKLSWNENVRPQTERQNY